MLIVPENSGDPRDPLSEASVLDFVGIGFGPSNLALAVATREIDASKKVLFFEQSPTFRWHQGMMIEGATMQISFLKDLATLRNPASPYTFLQYAKARGRLERFINLRDFYPTRLEFADYLSWVAEAFADQVRYATRATRVSPVIREGEATPWCFRVEVKNLATHESAVHLARNVVYAPGGRPRIPRGLGCGPPRVLHSSDFLPSFPAQFGDLHERYDFAVTGDGQSAGEIVAYLLDHYPRARIHFLISGCAPRATDASPFVNEHFNSQSLEAFYRSSTERREALLAELRDTNYGVIEPGLIDEIYRTTYLDEVKGRRRLFVHPSSRLTQVREEGGRLLARVGDRLGDAERTIPCDGVVLATGYDRALDPTLFADVLPYCERDEQGEAVLTRQCRVRTEPEMPCGLYLQGLGERCFGLGDTLLSLLPFRAAEILGDIREHAPPTTRERSSIRLTRIDYPPKRHLEHSLDKLYAVMERFRFATLISARGADEPIVTHVPLILDRSRGAKGVLFGHLDRSNPHVDLLADRRIMAIFHGPNSYISPHVYETDQLPTWNSISVHVHGVARLLRDQQSLIAGLCRIAERSENGSRAFRLAPDDPRIDKLIDYIVGFEIEIEEIIGRFKLSQDRNDVDRQRAAHALAQHTELGERALIEHLVGLPLAVDNLRVGGRAQGVKANLEAASSPADDGSGRVTLIDNNEADDRSIAR